VTRDGTAHGLAVWFDAVLTDGVGFSNAPGAPELIYGQAHFPWPEAVPLREGDEVECHLRADLVGGDYVWSWESKVHRREKPDAVDVHFRQSTFLGAPLTPESLARRASTHVPNLSTDGEITLAALKRMQAGVSLGSLAEELSRQHPARFRSPQDALDFVSDLSVRYGR
jgi:protein arginine N-methyltransferase 1